MRRKESDDELTADELRSRLVENKRLMRQERLEYFQKTRIVRSIPPQRTPQDDMAPESSHSGDQLGSPGSPRLRPLDRILLLVEIAALLILIYVIYTGYTLIGELNRESALAIATPTQTATRVVQDVVLPAGHTPPNSPGGVQPNAAEIPEEFRPLAETLPTAPVPTPGLMQATRIQIEAIGVDAPIVQGDGWEQLKQGVAQHPGTSNPGQPGNLVLSAHNDVFGEIFRHLDQLNAGDEVILYTQDKAYRYRVTGTEIVQPTQLEVLAPTEKVTLTLISCYPYWIDTQRIVVKAELIGQQ